MKKNYAIVALLILFAASVVFSFIQKSEADRQKKAVEKLQLQVDSLEENVRQQLRISEELYRRSQEQLEKARSGDQKRTNE